MAFFVCVIDSVWLVRNGGEKSEGNWKLLVCSVLVEIRNLELGLINDLNKPNLLDRLHAWFGLKTSFEN